MQLGATQAGHGLFQWICSINRVVTAIEAKEVLTSSIQFLTHNSAQSSKVWLFFSIPVTPMEGLSLYFDLIHLTCLNCT